MDPMGLFYQRGALASLVFKQLVFKLTFVFEFWRQSVICLSPKRFSFCAA